MSETEEPKITKRFIREYMAEERLIQRRRELRESRVLVDACYKPATHPPHDQDRSIRVRATTDERLELATVPPFAPTEYIFVTRAEAKTLSKVLASFAKRGDLREYR